MASSSPDQEQPPQLPPLHYKTWALKVSIHCPACMRKVKKVLQSVEGVYTTEIDMQQQKVKVTGNIEADTLIKKLIKNGRSAELWPDPKPIRKEKKPKQNENSDEEKKPKQNENSDEDGDDDDDDHNNNNNNEATSNGPTVRFGGVETITERLPENVSVVGKFPGTEQKNSTGTGGAKKKKKKKKKKNSGNNNNSGNGSAALNGAPGSTESQMGHNDQINLSRPFPNSHDQSYMMSYNAAHAQRGVPAYYYITSSPYMQADVSLRQSMPLNSFEMLSDENPHACYVM